MNTAPVTYAAPGYGVDPCPGCGKLPQPGEQRTVVPGVWFPWHTACFDHREELEELI